MINVQLKDFQRVSGLQGTMILLVKGNGEGARIDPDVMASGMFAAARPSIDEQGYWVIGTTPTGILAVAQTPTLRFLDGQLQWRYLNEDDARYRNLFYFGAELRRYFASLTPAERKEYTFSYDDLTESEIAALQQPATQKAAELQALYNELAKALDDAEAARVKAESSRVTEEENRVAAELLRKAEEQKRVTAEADRQKEEQQRQIEESLRDIAEVRREEAEQKREAILQNIDETLEGIDQRVSETLSRTEESVAMAESSAYDAKLSAEQSAANVQAVKEALEGLGAQGDGALAAQVLQNTGDIAANRTAIEEMRRLPNVALDMTDDGDIVLTIGDHSVVTGGSMNDDGEVILDLDIL